MKRLLPFFYLLTVFFSPNATAQLGPERVMGDMLIQFPYSVDVRAWDQQYPELEWQRSLSEPMNIHLFRFDETVINGSHLLTTVRGDGKVLNAQFNHRTSPRLIPDDSEYEDQWQYNNTGQSGGTPGADIEIEDAWEVTTGGVTAFGDTIVVCVLDDGIDADHPDIAPSLWVNRAEIPNNGLDDDGNGFIDDYRGWDVGAQNDNVYNGGGHGTPVAGIIGAKGNDGAGVTGVSWDVKLMIVDYALQTEASTIEGYNYPLVMRQRYNETNGEEGAFVVATNSSWGIDFGQPDDSPLWCAFYDTLGVHGILSCGATINGNQNVDVVGDLPTACSSEYLISVTNMNHFDQKVTSAGFGATTIDLGAFGQGTWTVEAGGGFGGFGGTSGATPHVCGTIGLLYALPCPDLMELANSDPAFAAEVVRDAILDFSEPNSSLEGITVTGGRLNVKNSMEALVGSFCGCPPPVGLQVSDLGGDEISVAWTQFDAIEGVTFEYRVVGATEWQVIENAQSPLLLSGLEWCTEYEYRLQSSCSDDNSDPSEIATILTDGCCENPENLQLTESTDSTASFAWDDILAAETYEIQFRQADSPDWQDISADENEFMFSGLLPCTDYQVRLALTCAAGMTEYGAIIDFTSMGCGACLDQTYCSTEPTDNSEEWIAEVNIGELSSVTEAATDGYEDLTGTDATGSFVIGAEYPMEVVVGYSGFEYSDYVKVYIDFNANGAFNEVTEVVLEGEVENGVLSGPVEISSFIAQPGLTRLRVVMGFTDDVDDCIVDWQYGEIEDYCITLVEPVGVLEVEDVSWQMMPNPAVDLLELVLPSDFNMPLDIRVVDMAGRLIINDRRPSSQQVQLDVSGLDNGVYLVELWHNGVPEGTRRLIKR